MTMNPAIETSTSSRQASDHVADIQLDNAVDSRIDTAWIRDRLLLALPHVIELAGRTVRVVSIVIVNDERMTTLHHRHLGLKQTTDVLAFDLAQGMGIEADIVICADQAAREAAQRGHSIERELLLYALHALLHCAGFDDHDPADHQAMHAHEDRILTAIGVGPTFETGTSH